MFAYCLNNPVNDVDLGGTRPVPVEVDDEPIFTPINGQNLEPFIDMAYGVSTIGYSGCEAIAVYPNVKNYSYTVVDGEVYFRENSVMVKPELNNTAKERVKGLVELRDCVHRLIDLQMWESDAISIRQEQAKLNALYDAFTQKYGLINSRGNALAFSDDSAYYLLCSLEELDEDGNLERKADMFTKRTIKQHQAVTSVDTAAEALAVSISERARVDMEYMSQLSGKDQDALIEELTGVVFLDPVLNEWQTADEYLSGNVREKLRQAQKAAEDSPGYLPNVEALQAAQPKDLDASEIEVRLGTARPALLCPARHGRSLLRVYRRMEHQREKQHPVQQRQRLHDLRHGPGKRL